MKLNENALEMIGPSFEEIDLEELDIVNGESVSAVTVFLSKVALSGLITYATAKLTDKIM